LFDLTLTLWYDSGHIFSTRKGRVLKGD
jgi:hypothetical protein